MRRSPARRPRRLALALTTLLGVVGCVDDGPPRARGVTVVAVAAVACDRPTPARGVGVVIGDGIVVTAGHVVEGPRREVTVDGEPATVVAVDARADLAVLRTDVAGAGELVGAPSGAVHVATPGGDVTAEVVRTGPLVVHDTTDRATYERAVHTIRPAVPAGTSGAPLVDAAGHVAGIVVLANRTDATTYVVTGDEVLAVLAAARSASRAEPAADPDRDAPPTCPG